VCVYIYIYIYIYRERERERGHTHTYSNVCWCGVYCKCLDVLIVMMDVKLINVLVKWVDESELWNDGYYKIRSKMIGSKVEWWVYSVCDYEVLLS